MFRSRCHRPQSKVNSIEYHASSSQISFLLLPSSPESVNNPSAKFFPHFNASLITFPPDVTLRLILSQKSFINLAAKHSSTPVATPGDGDQQHNDAHFELQGKILDENIQFSTVALKKELVLVIDNNIRLKFHESKRIDPNSAILNEHRKGLFRRLPLNNGHRALSDKQSTYPNDSLDLLFDTLHGELTYLTEYLKSHIGERHKFTIYPIQQQKQSEPKRWNEWETGIYKMSGDRDGTVNMALAADWCVHFLSSLANPIHFLIGVLAQWNQHLLRVQ